MTVDTANALKWGKSRHKDYHKIKWVSDDNLIKRVVQAARDKEKNGVVVELGCGLGHQLMGFVKNANNCIGVDADDNMLERAKRDKKIEYIHSDVRQVSGISADVVVARNVLHYIPGNDVLEIANRIMKQGAILILTQAVPPSLRVREWHNQLHDMLSVKHSPSTDDMVLYCRLGGLENIETQYCFHRMNVNEWLNVRVESDMLRKTVLKHHKKLIQYPEYEALVSGDRIDITVRFSIVSGTKN